MSHRQDGTLISLMHQIAERSYVVRFPADTTLSERVLMPAMGAERNGMEDARFVRFKHRDKITTYYGTYTAYDGVDVVQQLLETSDFLSFTTSPVVGLDANKGLALFPAVWGAASQRFLAPGMRRTRSCSPTTCTGGRRRSPTRCPLGPGKCSSSATAVRRSRPRPAGSRSPTASARCAPTGSGLCSWTSTTRPGSSESSASLS